MVRLAAVLPDCRPELPCSAALFGDVDSLSAIEPELSFWRHTCETIHEAGRFTDWYLLLKDEEIVVQPVASTKLIYEHCGIPWNSHVETWINQMGKQWSAWTAL